MKIPKTLRISGHDVKVNLKKDLARDERNMGQSCLHGMYINIDATILKTMQESTLIHEILHVINELNNIELSEKQIIQLECGIYQIINDNKLL